MKVKQWLLASIIMSVSLNLAGGCNPNTPATEAAQLINDMSSTTPDTSLPPTPAPLATTEAPLATTPTPEGEPVQESSSFSFADIANLEFWFGTGVGGWSTSLTVNADGTFNGSYHDSEMGITDDDYPNGTFYLCGFTGQFTEPVKVDDYTYSVKIATLKLDKVPDTEEIIEGVRYIYAGPYGLEDAEELLFYLPGIPASKLPEEYIQWVSYSSPFEPTDTTLPFYGLFNVKPGYGFSSPIAKEAEKTALIDTELASLEEKAAALEHRVETEALSQSEMNQITWELYQLWDDELNVIWTRLQNTLDQATMAALTQEEREWITYKEAEIKKSGEECEGGSLQPMLENDTAARLTKDRVYELAAYLR